MSKHSSYFLWGYFGVALRDGHNMFRYHQCKAREYCGHDLFGRLYEDERKQARHQMRRALRAARILRQLKGKVKV